MPTLLDKVVHIWDIDCQRLVDDEKVCVAGLPWKQRSMSYNDLICGIYFKIGYSRCLPLSEIF